jgi:hypothetical protein
MNGENKIDLNSCLDEEQVRVLIDLEATTRQSIASLLRESLELYVRFTRGEAAYNESPNSPIVFECSPDRGGNS